MPDTPPDLPITQMRRFFKIKREKLPETPHQPILPGKPVDIAAGPPDFRTELDDNSDEEWSLSSRVPEVDSPDPALLPDEGGRIGPRILFQDGMDANQQLPASGAKISDVVIGGAGCGSLLAGRCFLSLRWGRNSCGPLTLFSSVVGSSDTSEGIEQTEASTGMCTYNDAVASRSLCASCEGSPPGDTEAWGRKKLRRKVRTSQSRPGEHPRTLYQPHGSFTTPGSQPSFHTIFRELSQ